ncbi:hypothetical protein KC678_03160 [Candidatus Dojkabacteria bacterium]|uniref:Phosphoenolpyruvate synthase n=1 Tax=Candidatus Dojkabacteria bacterium TaxID=2099670 RepID=A0A955IAX1_9BACT|nr:hypothetical protein [Candidatus Dojkabacteria bacterium]
MKKKRVNTYIDDLVTATSADISMIGNEAFNFSRLYNQEIKVPDALALTTLTFDDFLVTSNSAERILHMLSQVQPFVRQTAKNASGQIINMIMTNEIPTGIRNSMYSIFQTLVGNGNKSYIQLEVSNVIDEKFIPEEIRSLSYFDINNFDDFVNKIRLIWASLFSTESIELRTNRYYRGPISLAILVRQMRKFELSGKVYSIPPITKENDTAEVTANFGILDKSIDLDQAQDSYKVDLNNRKIIEKTIVPQEFMILRNGAQNNLSERRTRVEISNEWKRRQKLDDDSILKLVDILAALEDSYKAPIEIEWGIETGELFVVDVEIIARQGESVAEHDQKEMLKKFGVDKKEIIEDDHALTNIQDEIEKAEDNDGQSTPEKINELMSIDAQKDTDMNWPKWASKYKLVANTLLDISKIDANNLHAMTLFNGTYFDSTDAILSKKVLPEMIFDQKNKLHSWLDAVLQVISVAATNGENKDFIYQFSNPLVSDLKELSIPEKFKKYYGDERFLQFPEALVSEVLLLQMLQDHYSTPLIHICIPYLRNMDNLMDIKKILNSQGLTRSGATKFYAEVAVPSMAYEIDEIEQGAIDGIIINYDVLLRISVYRANPREIDHKALSKLIKKVIGDAKIIGLETYIKFSAKSDLALKLVAELNPTGYIFSYMPSENQLQTLQEHESTSLNASE